MEGGRERKGERTLGMSKTREEGGGKGTGSEVRFGGRRGEVKEPDERVVK